jgi:lipoprotein-anchoring transpeptidase ErfK/SrfK
VIRKNRVVWTVAVSTGRPGLETELGRFRVYDKNPNAYSYVYNAPMPYASFFNGGDAIHEDSEVPVYPWSHGCVRTPPAFAPLLYTMDPLGSQVIVINR